MAKRNQLILLNQGVKSWNSWRKLHPNELIDLRGANLERADLSGAELCGANLNGANLCYANLTKANLGGIHFSTGKLIKKLSRYSSIREGGLHVADLSEANLMWADMSEADLRFARFSNANLQWAKLGNANFSEAKLDRANLQGAVLRGAKLRRSDLSGANLSEADLSNADLSAASLIGAQLVKTNLSNAVITNSSVFGISTWGVILNDTIQKNLRITPDNEPYITVDNLEVAQFIYLILTNEKLRIAIDTITSKVVLILGRFTKQRKAILDAIREELRHHNYLPVLFDFEKPVNRDITETVSTLAHIARFIIADITDAKSIPQELDRIIPFLPSVPVQPLLQSVEKEYGMFEHFKRFPWVLEIHYYDNIDDLNRVLLSKVISRAEAKARELAK